MYINIIDDFFDNILNDFNKYLYKNQIFKKIITDPNFVKYQKLIIDTIFTFIKTISIDEIQNITKNENNKNYIVNTIKRYCAFYIYLGIGYYYTKNKELFITNIIETSKTQDSGINNFFNSNNNSKIIEFYNIIKDLRKLIELKSIDKIKILLSNNKIKYELLINFFNDLGEDYIINYFLISDNFHNILKTIIFRQIYLKEEKLEINNIINEIEKKDAEYKYIDIIVSKDTKIVDFNFIQKFLTLYELKYDLADEIYSYIDEFQSNKEIILKKKADYKNFLFNNKIIIPISKEFLRYHKDNEKYETNRENKNKESTKIKYIINKINNIKNYYSDSVEKNPKLKEEISKLFYKQLDPKEAILYNDNEELKIIQKLEFRHNVDDYSLLIDLENVRKYSYVNYKFINSNNIKLRPTNTIQSIRDINFKHKKNEPIELRIGNNNLDLDLVGIAWNPSIFNKYKSLECFKVKDLIQVNTYDKMIKTIQTSKKNLYYWLFDFTNKISNLTEYEDLTDPTKIINIMLSEIYKTYINLVKFKFENYLNKLTKIEICQIDYLMNLFQNKYYIFDLNPEIKNDFIYKIYNEKIKNIEITEDEIDKIRYDTSKIIKLPYIKVIEEKVAKIIIGERERKININLDLKNALCNHHQKWDNILRLKKTEEFRQLVYDFVKKYVKTNERSDYLCKSCNELLDIKKYVFEGTYNAETDEFMTTSILVKQDLEKQNKYIIYLRTIKFLRRIIEKIAYVGNIIYFISGAPEIVNIRKKTSVKDIIDIILIHTEYLKNIKDRVNEAVKKYNINKSLTNLFFFELKDEIFLSSSESTDYYTTIKYNNILVYTLFIIILELNKGQLQNFKNDKRCNYFFFTKFGQPLFENLYLRINEKDIKSISNIPLLAYTIFYLSCLLTNNKIWLWKEEIEEKKNIFNVNVQKSIIHTLVDLINSIMEASFEKDKNYLYELLSIKFRDKLTYTFSDLSILKKIEEDSNKIIKFNQSSNKISFVEKKIELISLEKKNTVDKIIDIKENCFVSYANKHNKSLYVKNDNNLSSSTNCLDGKFHKWKYENKILKCSLCNQLYDTNIKNDYNDIVKYSIIKKLTKKYCVSGEIHELNQETSLCKLCHINPTKHNYSKKELDELDKNVNKNNIIQPIIIKDKKHNKIIDKLLKKFSINVNNNLELYVSNFIDKLILILGDRIKIKNETIYLKTNMYIIKSDYLGNELEKPLVIPSDENIIKIFENHPYFKKDIYYYKDNAHNVYVYYDIVTQQYLGYSDDNKNIKTTNNSSFLSIKNSIKSQLMLLGLENKYINLLHYFKDFSNVSSSEIIESITRERINNLKQLISNTVSIINNIRNKNSFNMFYNVNQKEIINEFKNKLKFFNTKDQDSHNNIFKNYVIINNNLKMHKSKNKELKFNNNYLNYSQINDNYNLDTVLIYYLINNFNKLLDYNEELNIKTELTYLIIRIIKYLFNTYYKSTSNTEIRKYDFLLLNSIEYIDENLVVNYNNEIIPITEIDLDKVNEEKDDVNEELNALDIDDYKDDEIDNEDIDYTMDAYNTDDV